LAGALAVAVTAVAVPVSRTLTRPGEAPSVLLEVAVGPPAGNVPATVELQVPPGMVLTGTESQLPATTVWPVPAAGESLEFGLSAPKGVRGEIIVLARQGERTALRSVGVDLEPPASLLERLGWVLSSESPSTQEQDRVRVQLTPVAPATPVVATQETDMLHTARTLATATLLVSGSTAVADTPSLDVQGHLVDHATAEEVNEDLPSRHTETTPAAMPTAPTRTTEHMLAPETHMMPEDLGSQAMMGGQMMHDSAAGMTSHDAGEDRADMGMGMGHDAMHGDGLEADHPCESMHGEDMDMHGEGMDMHGGDHGGDEGGSHMEHGSMH
jgi:hypothetical protein